MTITLYLALARTAGLALETAYALLTHFGSAQAIFAATVDQLTAVPGVDAGLAQRLLAAPVDAYAAEIQALSDAHIHSYYVHKPPYPHNLVRLPHPPLVIHSRGRPSPADLAAVAIVGDRNPTPEQIAITRHLAAHLADRGLTVVAGLARGIDTAAHQAALDIGGRTVAALGQGLRTQLYPPENATLIPDLIWQGAVFSHFPPDEPPTPPNMLARDQVIVGLARAVILPALATDDPRLELAAFAAANRRLVLGLPGSPEVDRLIETGRAARLDPGADLEDLAESIRRHPIDPPA